jgi:hypothetical protein
LVELDKFLKGEENNLKEHRLYVNYQFEYLDKSFPTVEMAHELISKPLKESSHGHRHHVEHKKFDTK